MKDLLHLSALWFSFTRFLLRFIQLESYLSIHIALPAETQSLDNTLFLFLFLNWGNACILHNHISLCSLRFTSSPPPS